MARQRNSECSTSSSPSALLYISGTVEGEDKAGPYSLNIELDVYYDEDINITPP